MIILYPFCQADEALAAKNAAWIMSLRNNTPLRVILVKDDRCSDNDWFGEKKIAVVTVKDRHGQWPQSPNTMFSAGARYVEYYFPKERSFLWLEPDAVPIGDFWLDKIVAVRAQGKKPFTGAHVPGLPEHLSGVAVYPNPLVLFSGVMLLVDDEPTPFDLVDAPNVLRQSHLTDLIQNQPRHLERVGETWVGDRSSTRFNSLEDFYKVATKECVLFHPDKHGDLINILRSRHGSAETPLAGRIEALDQRSEPNPATQTNLNNVAAPDSTALEVDHSHSNPKAKQGANDSLRLVDHIDWIKNFAAESPGNKIRVGMALTRAGLRPKRK